MSTKLMHRYFLHHFLWLTTLAIFITTPSFAATLRVAVDSNFKETLTALNQAFEQATAHKIEPITGTSSELYQQIINNAPYDIFFSAHSTYISALEQSGKQAQGVIPLTYAMGQLALWYPETTEPTEQAALIKLAGFDQFKMAIAHPKLSPYGMAAEKLLTDLGLHERWEKQLTFSSSVSQAYQEVASGAAQLGLVSVSHLIKNQVPSYQYWRIPLTLHPPIIQQALILKRCSDKEAAYALFDFLRSPQAVSIISKSGYEVPDPFRAREEIAGLENYSESHL